MALELIGIHFKIIDEDVTIQILTTELIWDGRFFRTPQI